jgi:Transposase
MHIASIGIDLGKTTFHLGASGERNKILLGRKFSRSQLLAYTANLPASLVGLEACAGAHFLGTVPREEGHQVRLIPAQFVKPYRKSNKNDFIDAEAIAKPWRSRTCALCRSRPRSNSIGRPCTGCGIDSSSVAPHCSTRSVAFCWSVASPFRRSLFTCAKISPQWWKMLSRT